MARDLPQPGEAVMGGDKVTDMKYLGSRRARLGDGSDIANGAGGGGYVRVTLVFVVF